VIHKNYVRPTALEQIRINAMLKFGCIVIATRKARGLEVPARGKNEVHHLVEGNKRLGHGYTIVLNSWYHRGVVPYPATSKKEARARYGAALSDGRKAFYASHGFDDRDLWVDTQGRMGMSVQMPTSKIVPRREAQTEAHRLTNTTGE
jgi:hypothetical protein